MRKYRTYKPFQDIWLTNFPSDWSAEKMKHLFDEKSIKGVQGPQLVASQHNGVILKSQYEARTVEALKGTDGFKFVKKGNFVISLRSFQGGIEMAHNEGVISPAYTILELTSEKLYHDYFRYLAKSAVFIKLLQLSVTGIREGQNVNYTALKQHSLPIPSMEEQQQIVRYLDWKTSQISRMIHGYERLISLLEERKTAVINEAVTKGIHKGIAMKDSGVDWLGEIPAQWDAIRCKYLFNELDLRSENGEETHLSMSQKYGLIPERKLKERHTVSESYAGAKICHKDDLVLNRLKAHLGVFALAPQLGVISPDYTVLQVEKDRILPKFAETVLKSNACRRELRIRVRGITEGFWRLYTDDFNTIVLPLPAIAEQREILDFLEGYNNKIDVAIKSSRKEIELLRERRTRLISDVVTGAVDVRGIEVPEYAVEQDMEVADDGDEYEGERAGAADC